jgi:hypothetical protein
MNREERRLTTRRSSAEAWQVAKEYAAELVHLGLVDVWSVTVRPAGGVFAVVLVPT